MECHTPAEAVRVVEHQQTLPSLAVPQPHGGVVGGGGGQVELDLYPGDPSVVAGHVVDLDPGRHGPHTHIGVLVPRHQVLLAEVHSRDEVTVRLERLVRRRLRRMWLTCM